jgi:hypothetical protein
MSGAHHLREYFVWSSLMMMELDAALAARDAEWVRDTARELAAASRGVGALRLAKAARELAESPDRWDVIRGHAAAVDEQMLTAEMTLRVLAELHDAA